MENKKIAEIASCMTAEAFEKILSTGHTIEHVCSQISNQINKPNHYVVELGCLSLEQPAIRSGYIIWSLSPSGKITDLDFSNY